MCLRFHCRNVSNLYEKSKPTYSRSKKVTKPIVLVLLGYILNKTEPQQALGHGLH